MADDTGGLTPSELRRMARELRARQRTTGERHGEDPAQRSEPKAIPQNMPRPGSFPSLDPEPQYPSRWARCRACREDVEVILADGHPDQGRCPRCRRNV